MVKRSYSGLPDNEPEEQGSFDLPSEREHLFQVTDIYTADDEMGRKLKLDDNTVSVKCEVVGGDEAGRTLLQRLSLDQTWKGFFATRLFLKAVGEDYKGDISIDTDMWCGLQFYATVVHNGKYANIKEYNFGKKIDQAVNAERSAVAKPEDIAWEE